MVAFFVGAIIWFLAVMFTIAVVAVMGANRDQPNSETTQWDWYQTGVDNGYCTQYFCDTHDGIPMSDQEIESWEEGNDDCYWVLRLLEIEQENN